MQENRKIRSRKGGRKDTGEEEKGMKEIRRKVSRRGREREQEEGRDAGEQEKESRRGGGRGAGDEEKGVQERKKIKK